VSITRDDLEAKAQELFGAVEETRQSVKDKAVLGVLAVAAVVLVAFVIGRRRGSRGKTVVEIYRV
jgi:ABC-type transporter Mla subunit MlaD